MVQWVWVFSLFQSEFEYNNYYINIIDIIIIIVILVNRLNPKVGIISDGSPFGHAI